MLEAGCQVDRCRPALTQERWSLRGKPFTCWLRKAVQAASIAHVPARQLPCHCRAAHLFVRLPVRLPHHTLHHPSAASPFLGKDQMDGPQREKRVNKYIRRRRDTAQRCRNCQRFFDREADFHCHTPCTQTMTLGNTLMYQCDKCSHRCPQMNQLVSHYDHQHCTRVYECLIQDCGKLDEELDYMQRHVRQAHLDQYEICPSDRCFRQFAHREQMLDHMMRDHNAGTARPARRDSRSGSSSSSDRNGSRDDRSKSPSRQSVGRPGPSTASSCSEASGRTPEVTAGKHYLVAEYEPQQCPTCKKSFSDPARYEIHSKCTMATYVDARIVFKCRRSHCPGLFHSIDDLVVHIAEHEEPRYTCRKCFNKYYTEIEIVTHIQKEHVRVGMLSKTRTGNPLTSVNQSSRQTHAKQDDPDQKKQPSTSNRAGPSGTTAARLDPQLRASGSNLESATRKTPAAMTAASTGSNDDKALPHTKAGTKARPAAATAVENPFESSSTRKVRVAHTPHSSPKPDVSISDRRRKSVSISLFAPAPKYGRHAPVQEPTPLSPTKRAALISQRRASATESQTGRTTITGQAAAHAPAAPAESEAGSEKIVKHITSESQPNPLCQTLSKAGPSSAGSSQRHAEPAPGLGSPPSKRSVAAIPAAATQKRRNLSPKAVLPPKRKRVDSKENAEPDANSAIPPHVDSGQGDEVDEDDGVPFQEVDFRPALCPGCQRAFESPSHMLNHPCASSDDGGARCPFCPDKHLSKKGVSHHLAYQHFYHRFRCKECDVTNAYKCYLLRHYATKHKDMHQCPAEECTLIFKKAINLKRHLRTHAKSCNFAPSSCSTPLAKPSASTSVSDSRPTSMSSAPPSSAKKDTAADSMTSDVTLTSQARVSTPPPASSGDASCDANSGQEAQDFVDMEEDVFLLPDSPDPLPMSFAEDDDDGDLLSKLMTEIEVPFDRTQEQVDKSITSQATLQEDDDEGEGILFESDVEVQFARTLEQVDASITSQQQAALTPAASLTTPAAAIEACVSEAGSLTVIEPEEVESANNQFSAESLLPVPSHQAEQSVPSSSSAISCSHPISPESEPVLAREISDCLSIESPAQGRKTMPVPVGRPSLSKHSLSCLPDPVWRCDACGVMLFSEAGHTCSADLLQLVTHNESHESVSLEDGFLCITLD